MCQLHGRPGTPHNCVLNLCNCWHILILCGVRNKFEIWSAIIFGFTNGKRQDFSETFACFDQWFYFSCHPAIHISDAWSLFTKDHCFCNGWKAVNWAISFSHLSRYTHLHCWHIIFSVLMLLLCVSLCLPIIAWSLQIHQCHHFISLISLSRSHKPPPMPLFGFCWRDLSCCYPSITKSPCSIEKP